VIGILCLLLSLQGDPRIERVDRVIGNVNRPLLWTPLRVTLSSGSGFSGDVIARSGFGFSVVREVRLRPGGSETLLLPAIDPTEVTAGTSTFRIPRSFVRPDLLVLVDSRLPYASELASTDKILYQQVTLEDLQQTIPRGLLEAADLILVREAMGAGIVAATRADADRAIARATPRVPSVEAVDRLVWPLAPQERWVPTKREWTLYFAAGYAFAAFLSLTVLAKRFPRFGLACVVGVALAGVAGFRLFPRSQMWATGQTVQVVPPAGDAREDRFWFLQSALELTVGKLSFPRLVKPVFPSMAGSEDPFVIRVGDKGCTVEGVRLWPGRGACFGGEEPRPAPMRSGDPVTAPLHQVVVVQAGRATFLGEAPAGSRIQKELPGGSLPPGASFEAWKRFVGSDGFFGVAGLQERAAADLNSDDLVDEHDRPPILIVRNP
jgi:hypothetical protein